MNKEDGRRLSHQAHNERRKQAVRLHKRGMAIMDIAAALSMGHGACHCACDHQGENSRWPQYAGKLIAFLEALIKDAGKKVFLILDNLRVHHSKPVKAWLTAHTDKIEVFFLPSYSPELNPDKRLNADLKFTFVSRVQVRTKDKLQAVTENHMAMLAAKPQRVKSYFQKPKVKYAA